MKQHTRGRWGFGDKHEICAIDSDQLNNGYFIAICEGPDKSENARRIVACVNACAEISTENIETMPSGGFMAVAETVVSLAAQRDQLLEALKSILKCGRGSSGRIIIDQQDEEEINRAIASVEQSN